MMKYLEMFIGALIMWTAAYLVGRMLFEKKKPIFEQKIKENLRIVIILFIFATALITINILNLEILRGTIKTICVYILQCAFFKLVFKDNIYKVTAAALILYLCLVGSEGFVVLSASVLFKILNIPMTMLKNHILTNTSIVIVQLIIVKIFRKKLTLYVKNTDLRGKNNLIIIVIILITLALLGFKMPLTRWGLNVEFIVTMLLLISFSIIGILVLKQKADIKKTTLMYQQLAEYSNITNDVLEEYRVVTHEHKNQLLVIRSMLENNDKEIIDYVESLLDKRAGIKYKWIGELNHLPLSGLKGLLNYKILEIESLKLNKTITISKDVSKVKLEKLTITQKDNLYSIMGVYLDNAIQAAKESSKKEIDIEIYKENKELVIIIANTYKGEINLEKIDNFGYTTKGKNHGVGLHIVQNILKNDSIFISKKYLLDNYFAQEIRIDLKQINKKH